jgi:hypothetical protein
MSELSVANVSMGIDEGCPMWFRVHNPDIIEFRADGGRGGAEFDVSFEVAALRRFLELGAGAVAEADSQRVQGQADAGREAPADGEHVA